MMKKTMTTLILIILFSVRCLAPAENYIPIAGTEPIRPYDKLWETVCKVESNNNPLAYNPSEKAYGIAQIRDIRVRDYFDRTGIKVSLNDCYNPDISKRIFMFYATQYDYRDIKSICISWNGVSKRNLYYKKILKAL